MRVWRITAGLLGILFAAFAIKCAMLATDLNQLSAEIRRMTGREIVEDDPSRAAWWYLVAAVVMAGFAVALWCYAAVARSGIGRDPSMGQPPPLGAGAGAVPSAPAVPR